jgi:hypothetical protein
MTYKDLLEKYVGEKAHFDLSQEGYYLLDFTGSSFANVEVREAHEEFVILFDEVEKFKFTLPYSQTIIRLP